MLYELCGHGSGRMRHGYLGYNAVNRYRCFGGIYCHHLQDWKYIKYFPSKCWYLITSPYFVTTRRPRTTSSQPWEPEISYEILLKCEFKTYFYVPKLATLYSMVHEDLLEALYYFRFILYTKSCFRFSLRTWLQTFKPLPCWNFQHINKFSWKTCWCACSLSKFRLSEAVNSQHVHWK